MEDEIKNDVEETAVTTVKGFDALVSKQKTQCDIYTNIEDQKKIFNLNNMTIDSLLNDCEGELIRVKEVLIKKFTKPLKEPIIDEDTGEVLKDTEITMCCILIDDNEKVYVTGSKVFTIQMMNYIQMFGLANTVTIKIVKNKQESGNKSLGFELV